MFFSINQIDNAFFEVIRLALVSGGYLPDVVIYNTESTFKTALQAIKASNKPIIKVFGVGNYKARNEVKDNKIVIDRLGTKVGTIGTNGVKVFEENVNGNFTEKEYPKQTLNITYQISFVATEQSNDDLIMEILQGLFDEKGFLAGIDNNGTTTNKFHYHKTEQSGGSNENFIERMIRYEVSNVFISQIKTIGTEIPPMTVFEYTEELN